MKETFRIWTALSTQFWRRKYGFVYYWNVQRTFKESKIKSIVFTRPHAMKRHMTILPMLRNRELQFRTTCQLWNIIFPQRGNWGCSDWYCDRFQWLAPNLAISAQTVLLVTRRSHWHPSLRSWVNRWPLRSGQWPKNGKNATSLIISYLSKLEPRFKDQNVLYGLRNTMRCL